jgi:hypothetical protein
VPAPGDSRALLCAERLRMPTQAALRQGTIAIPFSGGSWYFNNSFHMWYNCGPGSSASPESWHGQQGTCYARSADGYRWEKPDINGGTNRVRGSLAHDGNTVRIPPPLSITIPHTHHHHHHHRHHCTKTTYTPPVEGGRGPPACCLSPLGPGSIPHRAVERAL